MHARSLFLPVAGLIACLALTTACARQATGAAGTAVGATTNGSLAALTERAAPAAAVPASAVATRVTGAAPQAVAGVAGDSLLADTAGDVIPPAITDLGGGRFQRIRLVRVAGKYPLHRREEIVTRGNGGVTVVSTREMVADHLLVSLDQAHPVAPAAIAAATGSTVRRTFGGGSLALLAFPYAKHEDYPAAQQRLAAQAGVRVAESDWIVHVSGTPNDPSFPLLWGMNNNGQTISGTAGTVDADIDAPEAWNISTGSKSVLVGIIDTGIDESHPDLAANMWTNPGETGLDANGNSKATNGIDDDGDGYIDDVHGWDFVNEDNNPHDDHYHGTHCAGTIGGAGNNGTGVTGVCWNVSLVGLKFLNAGGSGATSDAVEAVLYANKIGCDLTSNSWGGGGFSQALKDAIDAGAAQGRLFVAAAGNNGTNNDAVPNYPSNYDSANIIAVAATDNKDALAYFSCYGATTVDLGAPGVDIYSCQPGGLYQYLSGTSMATPHVAGACALLKSANPALSGAQIKAAILANVDPVPALAGKTVTGGRLNVYKAVAAVSGNIITPTVSFAENGNGDGLLNPGEQAVMTTTLLCTGAQTFTNLAGTISTSDPAVTIESGSASFGSLAPAQSASGSVPFRVRLAVGTPTPRAVSLTLKVTADGSKSWSFPASVTFVTSASLSGTVKRSATGLPLAGATVTWQGNATSLTPYGSLITGAAGDYSATVADGTYQLTATATGMSNTATATATVPPAAVVDLALGASQLVVTPTTLAFTAAVPTATVKIANPGDAPLTYALTSTSIAATSGLWHASAYRSASGSGSSWYYGSEATRNYDTGSRTYGALVFPPVTVPAGNPQLTFKSWRRAEVGGFYDQSQVQVSLNGGLSWLTLRPITDVSGTWQTVSVSLASYVGQSVAVRFYFDSLTGSNNAYEGWYIDEPQLGSVALEPWLMATPQLGQVAAGGSADVVVTFLTDQFGAGAWSGSLNITSNAPVNGTAQVSVTADKPAAPVLALQALPTSDGAPGPGTGDGDGFPEAGESIALIPKWKNVGVVASGDITTTLSSGSGYIQIVTASATTASIPVGGTADASTPLLVTVDPATPDNTVVPLTLIADNGQGQSWTTTSSLLVRSASRLSGTAKNGAGSPLAGVTVSAGGFSAVTAADGTYALTGLVAGATAVSAAKTSYQTATGSVTAPPDAVWNPVLLQSAITLDPTSIALTANAGAIRSATVQVANPGAAPLAFTIQPVDASTAVPTGQWHRSSYRTVGGTQSWYYGSEATRTYSTGAANAGILTFSGIKVPAGTPTFSWQQWRKAEFSSFYDTTTVQVSLDGSYWATLAQTYSTTGGWETVSFQLSSYAGKTVKLRFVFTVVSASGNNLEGWYVSDMRIDGTPLEVQWLSASPTSGTVAPGASMTVTVTGDTTGLRGGSVTAPVVFSTNVPETPTLSLPVTLYVVTPPALAAGTPVIGDSGGAPVVGDGDGKAEPGETIAWAIPVSNSGNTAATDVVVTLTSASSYLTFPGSTSYGTVAGNASVTGNLSVAIAADCPDNTTIPVTCTVTSGNGGPWTTTLNLLVKWSCRLSGVVTDKGTGAGLPGVLVVAGSQVVNSAADGSFQFNGLPGGTTAVSVSKSNYVSIATSFVLSTDVQWNPALGIRDLTMTPANLQVTLGRGQSGSAQLTITNADSLPTTWSVSYNATWLSLAATSGTVAPGTPATVAATFTAGALGNGTYSTTLYFATDASRPQTYKQTFATIVVRSPNPPTATPISATLPEDGSKEIQLLGADADGDALTYRVQVPPAHGTVTMGANGKATYQPTALYHGPDTFTYRVSDGQDVADALVTLDVTHVNHVPSAWPKVFHLVSGVPITFQLPVVDLDQEALTIHQLSTTRLGTLIRNGLTATYTPSTGFVGQDGFTFNADDGQSTSGTVPVVFSYSADPTAVEWPTLGNGPEHLGAAPQALGTFSLTADWTMPSDWPIFQVAVANDRVFYATNPSSSSINNVMHVGCLETTAGRGIWKRDFADTDHFNPPTFHQGSIYLQQNLKDQNAQVLRLDAGTGATLWQASYLDQGYYHHAPTVDGDRVWINGGYVGGLYGFDRGTGAQVFFQQKQMVDQWTPTLSGGLLYAWTGWTLAAHDPETGTLAWSITMSSNTPDYSQFDSAIADAQRLYVINADNSYLHQGKLYAVDKSSHAVVWTSTADYRGMPALQGGKLFAYTSTGIAQVDTITGVTERTYPLVKGFMQRSSSVQPIVTSNALIGSNDTTTVLFARGDSTPRQTIPYGGHLTLAGSRLYIAGTQDLRAYRVGNRAPVVSDRTFDAKEGVATKVTLWANDPDDQVVTNWRIATQPAHGTATISNGILTYTSEVGFTATDTCTVIASDGIADSAPAIVTIQIIPRPAADALTIATQEGDAVPVTLHGSSPRNQALTYQITSQPAVGKLSGMAPALTYTPPAGFAGSASFVYTVKDAVTTSYPATVTVTVHARPVAQSFAVDAPRETPIPIQVQATSPRGQPLTVLIVKNPAHGALSVNDYPEVVYLGDPGFVGTDSWQYTVTDGLATSRPAKVTVAVKPGLPSGWAAGDLGAVGVTGSSIQEPASGDIVGSGGGKGMVAVGDSGHFTYTSAWGDFDLVALVPLPTSKSSAARVGLMVRESGDPGSRGMFIGLAGDKRVVWTRRTVSGGEATTSAYAITAATWVKISRRGNSLFGYRSADGVAWTLCGRVGMLLPSELVGGTLIASGTQGVALRARISQVKMLAPQVAVPGQRNINFQSSADAPVVVGGTTWSIADGAVFGPRWEGFTYGCDVGTTVTYNTDSPLSPDERYDAGLTAPLATAFTVQVPDGTYSVTMCVGDAIHTTGKLYPEINGVRVVTGSASSAQRWFTGTVTVVVTDGKLVLRNGTGATASRWCWLQIVPVVVPSGSG